MMRSIGLPELLVLFAVVVVVIGVLAAGAMLLVRLAAGGGRKRTCPHCRQQVPDFGVYCPLCGQKTS